MSEARRQHPVAAITNVLKTVRDNIITILIVLFVGGGGTSLFNLYILLGLLVLLLVAGVAGWWRFTYEVVDGELRIEKGLFVRKKIYMRRERIQVIDVSAGIVQRIFGLVAIRVKSAGGSSKETSIHAVTHAEAQRLKTLLRSVDKEEKLGEKEEDIIEKPPQVYTLDLKKLVLAASTSGNFGAALSIVAALFSQLDQLVSDDRMIRFAEQVMPSSIGASLVISTILFIVVFSWLLSFIGTFIKYYGFTLTVKDKELLIQKGLFEQKELTVPFNRIQAVRIKEALFRQPFGYAAITLDSASYDAKEQANSTMLFPFMRVDEIHAFIEEVVPDYSVDIEGEKVPAIALRRYLSRMIWMALFVIIPLWWWVPYGVYAFALIIPALFLGYVQFRDARIGATPDTMLLRSRWMSRTTAIIKKHRVQSVGIKQNVFQKRLRLFTYGITVASGNKGHTFSIRELDEAEASRFFSWASPALPGPLSPRFNNRDL